MANSVLLKASDVEVSGKVFADIRFVLVTYRFDRAGDWARDGHQNLQCSQNGGTSPLRLHTWTLRS